MTDKIKFKGTGRVTLTHDDGRVEVYEQHNMIVNSGFNIIISSLISSERPAQLSHVAIGTGTAATSETQTTLVTEKYRKAGTWTWVSGSKKFSIKADWDRGAVLGTITEGGVFNAATGGSMFDRLVFETPFTGAADTKFSMEFEFEVM